MLICIATKNLVLDLILALVNKPTARVLPLRNSLGTLLRDLTTYTTLINLNKFDIKSAIPIVEQVVNNAPNIEI